MSIKNVGALCAAILSIAGVVIGIVKIDSYYEKAEAAETARADLVLMIERGDAAMIEAAQQQQNMLRIDSEENSLRLLLRLIDLDLRYLLNKDTRTPDDHVRIENLRDQRKIINERLEDIRRERAKIIPSP